MPAYTSELIAVKINNKNSKVHIAFHQSYMAICGKRFLQKIDYLTIQRVDDIEMLKQILEDKDICSNCKRDISNWLSTNFIRNGCEKCSIES